MSVIPAKFRLDLYQGSTLDETWTFTDADGEPMDLIGWSGTLTVRGSYDGPPLLTLFSGGTPPSSSGLVLGGTAGTVRVYAKDEAVASGALDYAGFTPDDKDLQLATGVWDLELQNPAGERFRYAMGAVQFSREASY